MKETANEWSATSLKKAKGVVARPVKIMVMFPLKPYAVVLRQESVPDMFW